MVCSLIRFVLMSLRIDFHSLAITVIILLPLLCSSSKPLEKSLKLVITLLTLHTAHKTLLFIYYVIFKQLLFYNVLYILHIICESILIFLMVICAIMSLFKNNNFL